ncbi:MAG: hypothetical protein R2684_13910 [Pyrinomonadaceae bacterium]
MIISLIPRYGNAREFGSINGWAFLPSLSKESDHNPKNKNNNQIRATGNCTKEHYGVRSGLPFSKTHLAEMARSVFTRIT